MTRDLKNKTKKNTIWNKIYFAANNSISKQSLYIILKQSSQTKAQKKIETQDLNSASIYKIIDVHYILTYA